MRLWRTYEAACFCCVACAFAACGKELPPEESFDGGVPDATPRPPDQDAEGGGDAAVDGAPPDAAWCKRDRSGRCLPELLVDGLGPTYALAVRDGYVYYASYQKGQLWRTPADGGTTTTLGALPNPVGIVLDGDNVYVAGYIPSANGLGIGKVPQDGGGTIAELDPSLGHCRALTTDGTSIYALCGEPNVQVVRRGPLGNQQYGEPASYGSNPQVGAIAVDATHVYWTTALTLRRAKKDLTEVTSIGNLDFTGETFVNIALDATSIYVRASHSVLVFPKANPDGGLGEQIFDTDVATERVGLVVKGGTLDVVEPSLKYVRRMGLDGGQPKIIVSDVGGPLAIAVDGQWIYWTTTSGELRRLFVE